MYKQLPLCLVGAKRFFNRELFSMGFRENLWSECLRMSQSDSRSASKAYGRVAQVVLDCRELEASLLLKAAAKLQGVLEVWDQKPPSALADALLYNRRLWIVF